MSGKFWPNTGAMFPALAVHSSFDIDASAISASSDLSISEALEFP
jgi:hypothetical protein